MWSSPPVIHAAPTPHQPEDWLLGPGVWRFVRRLGGQEASDFLSSFLSVGDLIRGTSDRISHIEVAQRSLKHSLCLIAPEDIVWTVADRNCRVRFVHSGIEYDLAVTDLAWESRLRSKGLGEFTPDDLDVPSSRRVLLTISVGEVFHGYHYKLAAAVLLLPLPSVSRGTDMQSGRVAPNVYNVAKIVLGVDVSGGPARFESGDWAYRGESRADCDLCADKLHVLKRPYVSSGRYYEYWAIVCPRCRSARTIDQFPSEIQKRIKK